MGANSLIGGKFFFLIIKNKIGGIFFRNWGIFFKLGAMGGILFKNWWQWGKCVWNLKKKF